MKTDFVDSGAVRDIDRLRHPLELDVVGRP